MKKQLCMLLVLFMLFSLFAVSGCTESKDPASQASGQVSQQPGQPSESGQSAGNDGEITKEMLENSKPNEYVQEKLAAGMELYVAFIKIADSFFTNALSNGIKEAVEPLGYTFVESCAEGNGTLVLQQIENFSTMGCTMIALIPHDGDAVRSTVEQAQDNGSFCVIYGEPAPYTNVSRLDTYESAWQQACMAGAWIDYKYPDVDVVHCAVLAVSSNAATVYKTYAYQDYVESNPRLEMTFFKDEMDSIEGGVVAAEEALTTDPTIRVFINYDIGCSTGVDQYLVSQISQGLNIDEFGIFTAGENNNTRDQLSPDYAEPTAMRGVILDGETMWEALVDCILGVLDGTYITPYEYMQPIYTMTSFDYSYDSRLEG